MENSAPQQKQTKNQRKKNKQKGKQKPNESSDYPNEENKQEEESTMATNATETLPEQESIQDETQQQYQEQQIIVDQEEMRQEPPQESPQEIVQEQQVIILDPLSLMKAQQKIYEENESPQAVKPNIQDQMEDHKDWERIESQQQNNQEQLTKKHVVSEYVVTQQPTIHQEPRVEPPQQQQSYRNTSSASLMEDDMNMSSISFNSRLFNQINNMDSVSQVGENNSSQFTDDQSLDLGSVQVKLKLQESKLAQLNSSQAKLKELLKKAKIAIDSLNNKVKNYQDQVKEKDVRLKEVTDRNKDLTATLEIFQQKRNGIKSDQVRQILARFKKNDIAYTLIESKEHETEWYKDTQILNIQEELSQEWKLKRQVNYNTIFDDFKKLEDQMTNCIQQYEERLKRVNEYMEQSNNSYLKIQEDLKSTRDKFMNEQKQRDLFMSRLIAKSIEIKNQVATIDDKKSPAGGSSGGMFSKKNNNIFTQAQIGEMMSELEIQITKLMEIKDESGSVMSELRDHLIDVYQRIGVGLLKKHQVYDEQAIKQEQEWRATCDKLIEDHHDIKEEKERIEDESKAKITRLEQQLNEIKNQHYSLVRENKEQSEKLNKELENSIKTHYVKNIIYSYLTTNDPSVHQNLIKVLIKAMKFDEDESERIITFHEENSKSALSKIIGGLF